MIVDELPLPSCMETSSKFYFDASKDGSREAGTLGRWEGKPYTVEGLGNKFDLFLEEDKLFVEYEEHQEGKF